MLVYVCPDDIFWTTEHFVTKPGMVMQHHKPECHAEKLLHFDQCQGHNEGLYNPDVTVSVVSSKLLVSLQPNLVCMYSIIFINWCVLWKNGITAVKVKMLVNVCPGDIFWTTEYFVAKPGMVMQHHTPECHAEKLDHYVQCQGHSDGLYNQNMTISVVFSKLLVGL